MTCWLTGFSVQPAPLEPTASCIKLGTHYYPCSRAVFTGSSVDRCPYKHGYPKLHQWIITKRGLATLWDWYPLPSNRHHRSNGDCLKGKRENYLVCSVQYCAQQLYTVQCTHMNGLIVLWNGFCLTGPISLCLDSFLYMYYCMHAWDCNMMGWTWWDWSLILRTTLPSVLWHCRLGHLTHKTRPRYDL